LSSVEEIGGGAFTRADLFAQMVRQAAGKLEYRFCGCIIGDEFRSAFPADFDTREQIGLGSGKTVETSGFELQLTKNLDTRGKGDRKSVLEGKGVEVRGD